MQDDSAPRTAAASPGRQPIGRRMGSEIRHRHSWERPNIRTPPVFKPRRNPGLALLTCSSASLLPARAGMTPSIMFHGRRHEAPPCTRRDDTSEVAVDPRALDFAPHAQG